MDYHLIIIGGGAAGKDAALFAARAGIKTLLVEKDQLGGTSYHRGCYAMRALQACASAAKAAERSEEFGIGVGFFDTGWADWSLVRHRVTRRLTRQLNQDLPRPESRSISALPALSITIKYKSAMPAGNRKPLPLKTSSSLLAQGPFILGLCQFLSGEVTSLRWTIIRLIVINSSSANESQNTFLSWAPVTSASNSLLFIVR